MSFQLGARSPCHTPDKSQPWEGPQASSRRNMRQPTCPDAWSISARQSEQPAAPEQASTEESQAKYPPHQATLNTQATSATAVDRSGSRTTSERRRKTTAAGRKTTRFYPRPPECHTHMSDAGLSTTPSSIH